MNRTAIDKSEHVAAESSDLRSTNPWLASYRGDAVRGAGASETRWATRSSGASALDLRLWAGAGAAVLLVLGIGATEYVAAEGAAASAGHYPLDQGGGIAVSSPNLDRGDATANSRLAGQRAAAVRSYLIVQGIEQTRLTATSGAEEEEDPLRDNSAQSGRAGNRRVEILVQKPELER